MKNILKPLQQSSKNNPKIHPKIRDYFSIQTVGKYSKTRGIHKNKRKSTERPGNNQEIQGLGFLCGILYIFLYYATARLPPKGRAQSRLGTLGFLGFQWVSFVFVGFPQVFPRISESDALTRCAYDGSQTVTKKQNVRQKLI